MDQISQLNAKDAKFTGSLSGIGAIGLFHMYLCLFENLAAKISECLERRNRNRQIDTIELTDVVTHVVV